MKLIINSSQCRAQNAIVSSIKSALPGYLVVANTCEDTVSEVYYTNPEEHLTTPIVIVNFKPTTYVLTIVNAILEAPLFIEVNREYDCVTRIYSNETSGLIWSNFYDPKTGCVTLPCLDDLIIQEEDLDPIELTEILDSFTKAIPTEFRLAKEDKTSAMNRVTDPNIT